MSSLILDNLEIRNFRLFQHLTIEKLGRVNLVVGKNSVGKSSLLEALRIYLYEGTYNSIWNLLVARNEARRIVTSSEEIDINEAIASFKFLFFGRKEINVFDEVPTIQIGPINKSDKTLSISLKADEELNSTNSGFFRDETLKLIVQLGQQKLVSDRLDKFIHFRPPRSFINNIFVSASSKN
jgi:AAA15 family ATPase/GTPase